jgi:hypothetical protein
MKGVQVGALEQCCQEGLQVCNHLRKWRARWIKTAILRELSDTGWDDDTHTIVLEEEHCIGHVLILPGFSS